MTNETSATESDRNQLEDQKHLIFKLGDELYGAHLVSIREITRMQEIKPVPFMASHFKGILNLRGQIVSVIDLRLKFELPASEGETLLIVIETPDGPIGAVVDDIVSVADFPSEQIAKDLAIKTKIPVEFFRGVGHYQDRLVNLIDISKTLSSEDYSTVKTVAHSARAKVS